MALLYSEAQVKRPAAPPTCMALGRCKVHGGLALAAGCVHRRMGRQQRLRACAPGRESLHLASAAPAQPTTKYARQQAAGQRVCACSHALDQLCSWLPRPALTVTILTTLPGSLFSSFDFFILTLTTSSCPPWTAQ